jgi:hypothetical protein
VDEGWGSEGSRDASRGLLLSACKACEGNPEVFVARREERKEEEHYKAKIPYYRYHPDQYDDSPSFQQYEREVLCL